MDKEAERNRHYIMGIINASDELSKLFVNNTDFHKSVNSLIVGDNMMNVVYIFAELSKIIDNLFNQNVELAKMQPPPRIIVTTQENVDRLSKNKEG